MIMLHRSTTGAFALATALMMTTGGARAADDAKYPDWKGQWNAIVAPGLEGRQFKFDPTKPRGLGQQAPLTPEYQKVLADSMAEQAKGGLGNYPTARCLPGGMPRMAASGAQESIVSPDTTYVLLGGSEDPLRRIYTDGRDWPKDFEPSFTGYSIGKWTDADASGRYQTLEVETRLLKGPRTYDPSGAPLHPDNESVVTERIYLDKADPNVLHDDITTVDHALTRPWTVNKRYVRVKNPIWVESSCPEGNPHVRIDGVNYMMSADGHLMPAKKGQKPPDLRYFK
jgi:hypothetical protein